MASKVKKNKINFKGKTVHIGIDMHKHSWHNHCLGRRRHCDDFNPCPARL